MGWEHNVVTLRSSSKYCTHTVCGVHALCVLPQGLTLNAGSVLDLRRVRRCLILYQGAVARDVLVCESLVPGSVRAIQFTQLTSNLLKLPVFHADDRRVSK